jgi:hypothetical protein
VVAKAKAENANFGRIDQHAADAYFIAKNAHAFWLFMDGKIPVSSLKADQKDIFLSEKESTKGNISGTCWRAGDFWFDFRCNNPCTVPTGLLSYGAERRTSSPP